MLSSTLFAPRPPLDLGDERFDSELMWARLRAYRRLGLPMGCGTNNAEGQQNLREVGLVGGHAYSILDVREATTRTGERVRLLRVRNPHGCTEWNGEWSDASDMWSQLLGGAADGTGDADADGRGAGGGGPSARPSCAACSSSPSLPLSHLPACPYGARCYRQGNPQHAARFRHDAPAAADHASGFERTGVDDGTFWIDCACRRFSKLAPPHVTDGGWPSPRMEDGRSLPAPTPRPPWVGPGIESRREQTPSS